jgi:hypothetical protein
MPALRFLALTLFLPSVPAALGNVVQVARLVNA